MTDPLRKPEGLSWDPAAVELPDVPMIPPGEDALSATISAVLPTLTAPLAANVATLQAKETMFAGKLGVAQSAYQNADDSGSQSVGQLAGMLGQVGQQAGQMGQMAGAPAQAIGGQTGMFGQLIQQAMQGAKGEGGGQSLGGQDAPAAAGAPAGATASPSGAAGAPPVRDTATEPRGEQTPHHEAREPLHRAETNDHSLAGPSDDGKHNQAPVKPPEHQRHSGDEDLGRRL
jgi:hypothetical protein